MVHTRILLLLFFVDPQYQISDIVYMYVFDSMNPLRSSFIIYLEKHREILDLVCESNRSAAGLYIETFRCIT